MIIEGIKFMIKIWNYLDLLSIPQSGGKMSKRLVGGIIGWKYKTPLHGI